MHINLSCIEFSVELVANLNSLVEYCDSSQVAVSNRLIKLWRQAVFCIFRWCEPKSTQKYTVCRLLDPLAFFRGPLKNCVFPL